jgi:hypothetical protein
MPQCLADIMVMRLVFAVLALMLLARGALAGGLPPDVRVPLPCPRPPVPTEPHSFAEAVAGLDFDPADVSSDPTPCDNRLSTIAEIALLPRLIGPGACGGRDMVELKSVLLPDKTGVAVAPAPVLRCAMAESLAAWVRDAAAPDVQAVGASLRTVDTYGDYECRSRNRVKGAKVSEHGKGNAVDVRGFTLSDGRVMSLTDVTVDKDLREKLRDSACRRFTTVLGPGADPYHSAHIHFDLEARHNGYRICQWEVRVPPPAPKPGDLVQVPLPRPRPVSLHH